jgi:hypothetical protein
VYHLKNKKSVEDKASERAAEELALSSPPENGEIQLSSAHYPGWARLPQSEGCQHLLPLSNLFQNANASAEDFNELFIVT